MRHVYNTADPRRLNVSPEVGDILDVIGSESVETYIRVCIDSDITCTQCDAVGKHLCSYTRCYDTDGNWVSASKVLEDL